MKYIFLVISALLIIAALSEDCAWKRRTNAPEVYWINMDKSVERRASMKTQLDLVGYQHHRVSGITPKKIFIPEDIAKTWQTAGCMLQTSFVPPSKSIENVSTGSPYAQYTAVMDSLCGRGKKKNTPKELGCTVSHLIAMRDAIYSTTSTSKYALITEDDVSYPFDIDFEALAASAPAGFGILQLFNSNENSMKSTWEMYLRDNSKLWILRHPMKFFDFWSTCAYLINKEVMKPIIDAVAYYGNHNSNSNSLDGSNNNNINSNNDGWLHLKVVAGINNPCVPRECCLPGTDNFQVKPPCVWAPRGYQADSFLYAMTTTYMLSIPLIANGKGGNESTFHQDHVESVHKSAFKQQRQFINQLLTKQVPLPVFAKPACGALNVAEI